MQVIEIPPHPQRLRDFLGLSRDVLAPFPHAILPFPDAVCDQILDPAWKDRQVILLVTDRGRPLARAVARLRPNDACIGFFEALDHPDAVRLLLEHAEAWIRSHQRRRILGPMDGDTWHSYRFAIDPLDSPPFLKEPWNPPYYPLLWQICGYETVDTYSSRLVLSPRLAAENLAPFLHRAQRQGTHFRLLDLSRLTDELALLHQLSLRIFAENPHYTPIDLPSFLRLYDGVRPLLHPQLCAFSLAPDDRITGFVFAYPDPADAVRVMRGSRSLLAKARFLLRCRHQPTRVCIKSLGTLPECRHSGVGPALMAWIFRQIDQLGYAQALMCLMHDRNDSRRLDGGASQPFRRYVLFSKSLR